MRATYGGVLPLGFSRIAELRARSLNPHMKTKQPGMRAAPSAANFAWYSDGDTPTSLRNFELKDPRLL
jgi:hypothetical protein